MIKGDTRSLDYSSYDVLFDSPFLGMISLYYPYISLQNQKKSLGEQHGRRPRMSSIQTEEPSKGGFYELQPQLLEKKKKKGGYKGKCYRGY